MDDPRIKHGSTSWDSTIDSWQPPTYAQPPQMTTTLARPKNPRTDSVGVIRSGNVAQDRPNRSPSPVLPSLRNPIQHERVPSLSPVLRPLRPKVQIEGHERRVRSPSPVLPSFNLTPNRQISDWDIFDLDKSFEQTNTTPTNTYGLGKSQTRALGLEQEEVTDISSPRLRYSSEIVQPEVIWGELFDIERSIAREVSAKARAQGNGKMAIVTLNGGDEEMEMVAREEVPPTTGDVDTTKTPVEKEVQQMDDGMLGDDVERLTSRLSLTNEFREDDMEFTTSQIAEAVLSSFETAISTNHQSSEAEMYSPQSNTSLPVATRSPPEMDEQIEMQLPISQSEESPKDLTPETHTSENAIDENVAEMSVEKEVSSEIMETPDEETITSHHNNIPDDENTSLAYDRNDRNSKVPSNISVSIEPPIETIPEAPAVDETLPLDTVLIPTQIILVTNTEFDESPINAAPSPVVTENLPSNVHFIQSPAIELPPPLDPSILSIGFQSTGNDVPSIQEDTTSAVTAPVVSPGLEMSMEIEIQEHQSSPSSPKVNSSPAYIPAEVYRLDIPESNIVDSESYETSTSGRDVAEDVDGRFTTIVLEKSEGTEQDNGSTGQEEKRVAEETSIDQRFSRNDMDVVDGDMNSETMQVDPLSMATDETVSEQRIISQGEDISEEEEDKTHEMEVDDRAALATPAIETQVPVESPLPQNSLSAMLSDKEHDEDMGQQQDIKDIKETETVEYAYPEASSSTTQDQSLRITENSVPEDNVEFSTADSIIPPDLQEAGGRDGDTEELPADSFELASLEEEIGLVNQIPESSKQDSEDIDPHGTFAMGSTEPDMTTPEVKDNSPNETPEEVDEEQSIMPRETAMAVDMTLQNHTDFNPEEVSEASESRDTLEKHSLGIPLSIDQTGETSAPQSDMKEVEGGLDFEIAALTEASDGSDKDKSMEITSAKEDPMNHLALSTDMKEPEDAEPIAEFVDVDDIPDRQQSIESVESDESHHPAPTLEPSTPESQTKTNEPSISAEPVFLATELNKHDSDIVEETSPPTTTSLVPIPTVQPKSPQPWTAPIPPVNLPPRYLFLKSSPDLSISPPTLSPSTWVAPIPRVPSPQMIPEMSIEAPEITLPERRPQFALRSTTSEIKKTDNLTDEFINSEVLLREPPDEVTEPTFSAETAFPVTETNGDDPNMQREAPETSTAIPPVSIRQPKSPQPWIAPIPPASLPDRFLFPKPAPESSTSPDKLSQSAWIAPIPPVPSPTMVPETPLEAPEISLTESVPKSSFDSVGDLVDEKSKEPTPDEPTAPAAIPERKETSEHAVSSMAVKVTVDFAEGAISPEIAEMEMPEGQLTSPTLLAMEVLETSDSNGSPIRQEMQSPQETERHSPEPAITNSMPMEDILISEEIPMDNLSDQQPTALPFPQITASTSPRPSSRREMSIEIPIRPRSPKRLKYTHTPDPITPDIPTPDHRQAIVSPTVSPTATEFSSTSASTSTVAEDRRLRFKVKFQESETPEPPALAAKRRKRSTKDKEIQTLHPKKTVKTAALKKTVPKTGSNAAVADVSEITPPQREILDCIIVRTDFENMPGELKNFNEHIPLEPQTWAHYKVKK